MAAPASALALGVCLASGAPACAQRFSSARPARPARPARSTGSAAAARSPARAPSLPPLAVGEAQSEEASASAPASGGDALTTNGLNSPLCRAPGELSAAQQRNCQTADFVAAPDPTNNYAFDVNIDTGVAKWGNDMSATLENFAQFGWMALVSATHALVVMFEWCYSLNLLSGSLLEEVTAALHSARLTFTDPWLAIVLAVASAMLVYRGLIRRQVADSLGAAAATTAMMVCGLWAIADPAGSVGAVEQWANEAGVDTMAAVASGTPSHPRRTLAQSMQTVFSSVVGTPWCYMEFGNVDWCEDSARLDGELRDAALAIAKTEEKRSGCKGLCDAGASPGDRTLAASAALLREAQSNGELFLALPANEPERNSAKDEGTLLRVLCGGSDSADKCRGPTAPEAEFRTEKSTGSRLFGLLFIWFGALGMLLLLGFLALRLLYAALMGVFFLLLAPAAVLAPALGEAGRAAFRSWALKLMGAAIAKLVYSFLLGVVLMTMKLLLGLTQLGWWAQWLLISAFWWGAFLKRDQLFAAAAGGVSGRPAGHPQSIVRRMAQRFETPRALLHLGRTLKHRSFPRAPEPPALPRGGSARSNTPSSPDISSLPSELSQASASASDGGDRERGRQEGAQGADRRGRSAGQHHRHSKAVPIQQGRATAHSSEQPSGQPLPGKPGESGGQPHDKHGFGVGFEHDPARHRDDKHGSGVGSPAHEHDPARHRHEGAMSTSGSRRIAGPAGALQAARGSAQGPGQPAHARLERTRRKRREALASGNTRRAAKLEKREQRVERKLLRRQMLAVGMLDPEVEVGEVMSAAMARGRLGQKNRAIGAGAGAPADGPGAPVDGPGAPADGQASEAQSQPARPHSRVMDDARAVAERRKRQLGWEPEE